MCGVWHCGAAVSVNVIVKLRVDSDYKCLSKCTLDVCLKLALKLSYLTDANACGWKRGKSAAPWPLPTSGGGLSNIHRPRTEETRERERNVGEIQFRNELASMIFVIITVFRVHNTMFTTTLIWYRYVLYL